MMAASPARRIFLVVVTGVALFALVGVAGAWYVRALLAEPLGNTEPVVFEVSPGTSLSQLMMQLSRQGVISYPRLSSWWGEYQGYAHQIKVGEYQLDPGLSLADLLTKLVNEDVVYHEIKIIEGMTLADVLVRLRSSHVLRDDLLAVDTANAASVLDAQVRSLEGYFYPDTYNIRRGDSARALLKRAHQTMKVQLDEIWSSASAQVQETLVDPYGLLVLASIVEKETGLDADRPQIAQVFHNRLRQGMRLQSDPTVIYGLGSSFDGNLTRAHLRKDTPFNSYTRHGLPPTPIAIPSMASVRATAAPSQGELLYFVATGDGDGSSVFSKTLDEHNHAVQRYQLRRN